MPDRETIARAKRDKQEGKSPSTQAGEFVRQEMDHIRDGKHGARNTKQAIAIGLSEARRAGVDLPPPKKGTTSARTRRQAERETTATGKKPSTRRSQATRKALKREGHSAASHASLASHARASARTRTAAQRSASAKKAARTRANEKH
jgi:hypothetical protein